MGCCNEFCNSSSSALRLCIYDSFVVDREVELANGCILDKARIGRSIFVQLYSSAPFRSVPFRLKTWFKHLPSLDLILTLLGRQHVENLTASLLNSRSDSSILTLIQYLIRPHLHRKSLIHFGFQGYPSYC